MTALHPFQRSSQPLSPMLWFGGALAWVIGLALQMQEATLAHGWVYGGTAIVAMGVWVRCLWWRGLDRVMGLQLAMVLFCGLLVGWGYAGWRATLRMQALAMPYAVAKAADKTVQMEGVVDSMVQATEYGVRFRWVPTRWVPQAGGDLQETIPPLPASIMVYWTGGPQPDGEQGWSLQAMAPVLLPGDRWRLTMRLKAVHGASNPGGFDYELWMWEQGIAAVGSVKQTSPALMLERGWSRPIERLRQDVRDRITAHFAQARAADDATRNDDAADGSEATAIGRWGGVIAALVVGDQNAVARADWELFRTTGLAHLLSISGLHITMFAWAASALLGRLWRRSSRLCLRWPAPVAAAVLGWVLALAYALYSGWALPAQRTVAMLGLAVAVKCSGASWPWQRVWLLALVGVAAADPWAVLSPGFWLSFVAVGLLMASDGPPPAPPNHAIGAYEADAARADDLPPRGTVLHRMGRALWRLSREQLVMWVGLSPLMLYLFQQQSVVGLLANLVAGPWMTLVITPLGMLGVVWAPAWNLADYALALQYQVLLPMSQWSLATFGVAVAPLWISVAGMGGAALLVLPIAWPIRLLGLPLVLCVLLWQAPRPDEGQFEVVFADVGQGNGVLIRTLSHTLVYDTGPRFSEQADTGQRVVVPLLRGAAESPEVVVVSHQDNDHAGGAASVLRAYPSARLVSSVPTNHPLTQLRPLQRCMAGPTNESVWQWNGVRFEFLHPQMDDYQQALPPNAMSCVLRISNGQQTVLLLGDIEAPQEERLRSTMAAKLAADVMLVPHHGSKTSSTGVFLDAIHPRVAVVQAGYNNRYGHPAERILQRYDGRGIVVVDTPHCGALTWRSDRPFDLVCNRQMHARYWHHQLAPRPVGAPYPGAAP